MIRTLGVLGVVLLLGGVGHSAGVLQLYVTSGVPDANRIMVDVWVAQAQLLGGGLYLAASRAARRADAWRGLATFGALTIVGFSLATVPVLIVRAPLLLRIPTVVYLLCSAWILAGAGTRPGAPNSILVTDAVNRTESTTT